MRPDCYLGGAGSTRADIAGAKHLLIAQDPTVGVLLVVQKLLECGELVVGVQGALNLLQEPTDLVWIVFHLEKSKLDSWDNTK